MKKEQQLAPETINAAEHYAATASASGEGRVARQVRQEKYKITAVPNGQRKMEKKSQVAWQNNGGEPLEGVGKTMFMQTGYVAEWFLPQKGLRRTCGGITDTALENRRKSFCMLFRKWAASALSQPVSISLMQHSLPLCILAQLSFITAVSVDILQHFINHKGNARRKI